ncbi:MAG: DUF1104 domain-containing protein [Planctomycetes bacterium]|nr:DUF1104 domain-containing protein [Planctomycetota bacterium]
MKIDYLKDKTELVSVVLLCVSAVLAVSILVKVTGFFTASVRAEKIVTDAIEQNTEDANDANIDKYFAKYKMLADALKKNNLFAPPAPKQHPVKEVLGIFGDEVIIRDKLYKVGSKIGDATIVSIEATEVTIEWDGKKKTFSPMDAGASSGPGGPRGSRATARGEPPRPGGGGSAQMTTIRSQGGPGGGPGGGFGRGMMERFQNMSEGDRDRFRADMQKRREQYTNMSEAEREKFRNEMRQRMMGGGGRPPGGGRGPGDGRRGR